jgi:hypothetical protein
MLYFVALQDAGGGFAMPFEVAMSVAYGVLMVGQPAFAYALACRLVATAKLEYQ